MKIFSKQAAIVSLSIILLLAISCGAIWFFVSRYHELPPQVHKSPSAAITTQNPLDQKSWQKTFEWREDPKDEDSAFFTLTLKRDQDTITGDHCWYSGHQSFLECKSGPGPELQSTTGTVEGSTAHLTLKSYRDNFNYKADISWDPASTSCLIDWHSIYEDDLEFYLPEERTLACK